MSELDDVLEHFGVKGMKWGVRNDSGHEGQSASPRKIAKLDAKFEKKAGTAKTFFDIYNKGAEDFNRNKIDAINNKPMYKKAADAGIFHNDQHPMTKQYHKEVQEAFVASLNKAANSLGTNASGTKRIGAHNLDAQGSEDWSLVLEDIKHASETVKLKVTRDSAGVITSIELVEPVKHFGVKGMHWGVRRSQAELTAPSSDFVKSREKKTIAKTSGTKALSNEELQTVITRMNLERQFSALNPTPGKAATKFVVDILSGVGKQQSMRLANDVASKQIARALAKANE